MILWNIWTFFVNKYIEVLKSIFSVRILTQSRWRLALVFDCYLGFSIWHLTAPRLATLLAQMLHKNIALTIRSVRFWEEKYFPTMASILRTISSTLKTGLLNGNGKSIESRAQLNLNNFFSCPILCSGETQQSTGRAFVVDRGYDFHWKET